MDLKILALLLFGLNGSFAAAIPSRPKKLEKIQRLEDEIEKAVSSGKLRDAIRLEQLMENEILLSALEELVLEKKDKSIIDEMMKTDTKVMEKIAKKLEGTENSETELRAVGEELKRNKRAVELLSGLLGSSSSGGTGTSGTDEADNLDEGGSSALNVITSLLGTSSGNFKRLTRDLNSMNKTERIPSQLLLTKETKLTESLTNSNSETNQKQEACNDIDCSPLPDVKEGLIGGVVILSRPEDEHRETTPDSSVEKPTTGNLGLIGGVKIANRPTTSTVSSDTNLNCIDCEIAKVPESGLNEIQEGNFNEKKPQSENENEIKKVQGLIGGVQILNLPGNSKNGILSSMEAVVTESSLTSKRPDGSSSTLPTNPKIEAVTSPLLMTTIKGDEMNSDSSVKVSSPTNLNTMMLGSSDSQQQQQQQHTSIETPSSPPEPPSPPSIDIIGPLLGPLLSSSMGENGGGSDVLGLIGPLSSSLSSGEGGLDILSIIGPLSGSLSGEGKTAGKLDLIKLIGPLSSSLSSSKHQEPSNKLDKVGALISQIGPLSSSVTSVKHEGSDFGAALLGLIGQLSSASTSVKHEGSDLAAALLGLVGQLSSSSAVIKGSHGHHGHGGGCPAGCQPEGGASSPDGVGGGSGILSGLLSSSSGGGGDGGEGGGSNILSLVSGLSGSSSGGGGSGDGSGSDSGNGGGSNVLSLITGLSGSSSGGGGGGDGSGGGGGSNVLSLITGLSGSSSGGNGGTIDVSGDLDENYGNSTDENENASAGSNVLGLISGLLGSSSGGGAGGQSDDGGTGSNPLSLITSLSGSSSAGGGNGDGSEGGSGGLITGILGSSSGGGDGNVEASNLVIAIFNFGFTE